MFLSLSDLISAQDCTYSMYREGYVRSVASAWWQTRKRNGACAVEPDGSPDHKSRQVAQSDGIVRVRVRGRVTDTCKSHRLSN